MLALCVVGLGGCKRHDMYSQGKIQTWDNRRFFPEGLATRPPAPGTVPVREDDPDVKQPKVVTEAMLARGAQRFDIFCSMCHGRTGDGDGMIVQRGFPHPPSFNSDRLRRPVPRISTTSSPTATASCTATPHACPRRIAGR